MRRAARRDTNEPLIVEAARKIGLKVFYTSELGDLIVQFGDVTELWEVKTETGKLTDAQCRMRQAGLKARTVRTLEDVLQAKREIIGKPVDLLVCCRGETSLMECKSPKNIRNNAGDGLTKAQVEFIARWPGKLHIVTTPDEAIRAVLGDKVMA